jgi:hypothetical protein
MNDVKIARLTGVFGVACVALTFARDRIRPNPSGPCHAGGPFSE